MTMNDAIFRHIRTHFKSMEGYSSAGMEDGKSDDKLYLNANENPYELPGLEGLNRYPEPQPLALLEAYAQNYGVENTQVAMTRGADEALVVLTKIFCEPHKDKIVICSPTFGMYAVDAYAMPAGVIDIPLIKTENSFELDKDNIINAAKDNAVKMVFLCSPNNPTGTSLSHDIIAEICDELEGEAIVILDETYAEFSSQGSMVEDLESTPNLIILRTLSKSYALAGMRMGCILCADTDFITMIKTKVLDAYPLPRLSIEAAFHVLSPEIKSIALKNIDTLVAERKRMETALKEKKLIKKIYESDANFLLLEIENAKEFQKFAARNNVIIRDFSSKTQTEGCLRLSIGKPEQNDRVLELLDQFEV